VLAYRIADGRHKIYDSKGAAMAGGRWNSIGRHVIYCSESFAGALIEVLVHASATKVPRNHQLVTVDIPDGVKIETVDPHAIPGWDRQDLIASRAFGDLWLKEGRTAVLRVPSVPTEGREHNLLINPNHPDFALVIPGKQGLVRWDDRLLR
jgi:RES domain-containing protein